MTNTNVDNAEKVLIHIEDMIAQTKDSDRLFILQTARRHMKFACSYLNHDKLDRAGPHLEAARDLLGRLSA